METEANDAPKIDNEFICNPCQSVLQYPYIQCSVCKDICICLSCFGKGKEFECHKNDHGYIIKQNSPIFEKDWKAKEELELLSAIAECGLGNWSDVSKCLTNKSAEECKRHYLKFYIENPCDELSEILNSNIADFIEVNSPFHPIIGIDDPPRPLPCSVTFREMAGYNAARSEFTIEYLNDAEMVLDDVDSNLIENDDEPYIQELVLALIDIYRRELGERSLRKRTIRNHGLINLSKASIIMNQYKALLPEYSELIPAMYSLLSHSEITYLTESLCLQQELRCHIRELKECRINGIIKQAQVSIYETLKKKREIMKRKKHKLVLGPELGDLNVKELVTGSAVAYKIPSMKRTMIPIDITGEPEYETLNAEEQEICSSLRILPTKYNKIKYGMIEECRKMNGLQLRHARSHFKIDVNKIRKIYDYLLGEGLIYRPFPNK